MDSHELQRLSERVAALESHNRRLGRAVMILLVVLASTVWMGQRAATRKKPAPPATPRVVEAEQFMLKGPKGQVLATLGVSTAGPELKFLGPNGTERAVLGLDTGGNPRLVMLNAERREALSLALNADGVPSVELLAANNTRLRMVAGAGGPGIGLLDQSGTVRLALDLKSEGPLLALTGSDKIDLATLSATDKGPSLAFADLQGHPRITFTVRTDQAVFGIRDVKGDVRVGLEVRAESPALGLYGPNGKPLFVKP